MAFNTPGITVEQLVDLSALTKAILASGDLATGSALATLTTEVNAKASQADLDTLTTTVGTKAAQTDLDTVSNDLATLTTTVGTKAAQTALDALSAIVDTKAAQTDLDALTARVTSLETPRTYTTALRPDPTTLAAGTPIYDTDLAMPLWTDGTAWRDAAGTLA